MEVKGKLIAKASNGKGFKLEGKDIWFNATDEMVPVLGKINKGAVVEITVEKKGINNIATSISTETAKAKVEETGFNCEDCGAKLKDGKFKKCYMCNKKTPKEEKTTSPSSYSNSSKYGTPEDVAGKEVGCAANCAATVLSGRQEDPETLLEMFKVLMNGILEHIRLLK